MQKVLVVCGYSNRSTMAPAFSDFFAKLIGPDPWFSEEAARSMPRQLFRGRVLTGSKASLPPLQFDVYSARADTAGAVVIGVPLVVGGALFLLVAYWFFFLRDRAEDDEAIVPGDAVQGAAAVETEEACATERVLARQASASPTLNAPPIWVEHMKYRESKAAMLFEDSRDALAFGRSRDFNLNHEAGDDSALSGQLFRKLNSNFLPDVSSGPLRTKSDHSSDYTDKHHDSKEFRIAPFGSAENSPSRRTPERRRRKSGGSNMSSSRSASPALAIGMRRDVSFSDALMCDGASEGSLHRTPSRKQRSRTRDSASVRQTNFFDAQLHSTDTIATDISQIHKRSSSTEVTATSLPASRSVPLEPNRPRAHVSVGKTRPPTLELFLGESKEDRARQRENAELLEAGLKSLSLAVALDGCGPRDFRKAYSIVSDVEHGDAKNGGFLSYLGSFVSFRKSESERKEIGVDSGKAMKEPYSVTARESPSKGMANTTDQEVVGVLRECSPAELVRAIERMRSEIEKKRTAAGIKIPFQVLPEYIDDSIFIIKATATYLSEERLSTIRARINARPTSQRNKIAELAALELVPCGSIDDRELKRLRNYAIDLVRCCREVRKDPMWVWVPPPTQPTKMAKKHPKRANRSLSRQLTDKEKFQLALNPRSSIGEIARQNSTRAQHRTLSSGQRRLEDSGSDSGASFMSQSNFQDDNKSLISDTDKARVKHVFSVIGTTSRLEDNSESDDYESENAVKTDKTDPIGMLTQEDSLKSAVDDVTLESTVAGTDLMLRPENPPDSCSARGEENFDMATVCDKGSPFQELQNSSLHVVRDSCSEEMSERPVEIRLEMSSSTNSSDESDESRDITDLDDLGDNKERKVIFGAGRSSGLTVDTEDSHVFRVTDDKPTPTPVKSPIVPKLGLSALRFDAVKSPTKSSASVADSSSSVDSSHQAVPKLADIFDNFGSESGYSSNEDEDRDEFGLASRSLAGMVALGSGRMSGNPRTSFGSNGRNSFGSAGSEVGVDSVIIIPSGGVYTSPRYPQPSPRTAYPAPSPRDADFVLSKPHRRISKHSLVPDGHEHLNVVPPSRSSSLVPTPYIHSSSENLGDSR